MVPGMSITVHHLDYSRSLRVLWMLEELGLSYSVREWKRDAQFRAPIEAQRVHPLGRFPMVEVDGRVLVESGAILEYFAEREGKLRPAGGEELLAYRFFLHYAEASVMPPLLVQLILDRIRGASVPWLARPVARAIAGEVEKAFSRPAIDLHFGFMEQALAKWPFVAGDALTMADIQLYFAVEAGANRGAASGPILSGWLARVREREAFQRAVDKGGPALPSVR